MVNPETIRLWFENLHVSRVRPNGGDDILPLSALSHFNRNHIHGGLRIEIGGRLVPHVGYFGNADDVCFAIWLDELKGVSTAFSEPTARYVFDEGEEGQPAFVFERSGESGFFSIVDSQISGTLGDAEWQRVEFVADNFLSEYARFQDSFITALRREAPGSADEWMALTQGSRKVQGG